MGLPHTLGSRSQAVYDTLHPDLQLIIDWSLNNCAIDFTLTEGHRPVEKQFEYFKRGRKKVGEEWVIVERKKVITYIDGITKKGKHNFDPSLAFDFCAHVAGKPELTWDKEHLVYLASAFVSVGNFMFNEGMINYKVRWGGNWDNDGDLSDERFYDRPHIELYQ